MNPKISTDIPEGRDQFVRVWEHNGEIWSDDCRIDGSGKIEIYDEEMEEFKEDDMSRSAIDQLSVYYITK